MLTMLQTPQIHKHLNTTASSCNASSDVCYEEGSVIVLQETPLQHATRNHENSLSFTTLQDKPSQAAFMGLHLTLAGRDVWCCLRRVLIKKQFS